MLPDGIVNNRRRIIELLVARGPLSRTDLARLTHLSKPAISGIVAELLGEKIVVEGGEGDSTGGRKPIMLRLGGTRKVAVGVEIDAHLSRFLLVTLDGEPLARGERPTPARPEELPETIAAGLDELLGGPPARMPIGCGVAIPGLVDVGRGTVDFADRLGWRGVPLRDLLQARLDIPVMVTDRGKAAALGELWHLDHRERDNLIYIYLGCGVAGAIILGNALHLGPSHTAGEIGHMVVDPSGPRCECGRRGCLEAHISTTALLARARRLLADGRATTLAPALRRGASDDSAITAIGVAAARGDGLALELVAYVARWLGQALANLVNAINPALIVLGGPLAAWGDVLVPSIERQLDLQALPVPRQAVRVATSQAEEGAALGAAVLVLQRAGEILANSRLLARIGDRDH